MNLIFWIIAIVYIYLKFKPAQKQVKKIAGELNKRVNSVDTKRVATGQSTVKNTNDEYAYDDAYNVHPSDSFSDTINTDVNPTFQTPQYKVKPISKKSRGLRPFAGRAKQRVDRTSTGYTDDSWVKDEDTWIKED